MKMIVCPHCHATRSEDGINIDGRGVICITCNKVIFPVNQSHQPELEKKGVKHNTTGSLQHPYYDHMTGTKPVSGHYHGFPVFDHVD